MKSLARLSILFLGIASLGHLAFAANETVPNLRVTADDDYLNILWDAAANDVIDSAEGYALQWSPRQTEVKISKPANLYESSAAGKSLRRSTFENNRYYYTRVYVYATENRSKELISGSKILKWKVNHRHEVESSLIDANDPVIVKTVTSTDGSTSDAEFGVLRSSQYDTFADFSWSRPKGMTSSDYDGFMVTISKNSDASDPIAQLTVDRNKRSLRILDLSPSTRYYARGHFYEDKGGSKVSFGDSAIKSFQTIAAVPRDGSSVKSRNLMKIEKKGIYKLSANDAGSTTSTNTSTTTTNSTVDEDDDAAVKKRIAAIKSQMRSLQSELNRLETKIGAKKTTFSSSTNTSSKKTSSSSNKSSLRERLKAILAKKRASK